MSVIFTSFYSEEPGHRSLDEYEDLMLLGQRAMEGTNPDGRYVVLTDARTQERLSRRLETALVADPSLPLMTRKLDAQLRFVEQHGARNPDDTIVLAGPDVIANRNMTNALAQRADVGLIWRMTPGKPISDILFIRLSGIKYLRHACKHVATLDDEQQRWFGDMTACSLAAGPITDEIKIQDKDDKRNRSTSIVYVFDYDGLSFRVYPTETHCAHAPKRSAPKRLNNDAYMMNFKGERKQFQRRYVEKFLLRDV